MQVVCRHHAKRPRSQPTSTGTRRTSTPLARSLSLAWLLREVFRLRLAVASCYPDCVPRAADPQERGLSSRVLFHALLPLWVRLLWRCSIARRTEDSFCALG